MPEIFLTRDQICLVDECDLPWLRKHMWTFQPEGKDSLTVGYAVRWIRYGNGRREKVYMHREITDCPKGMVVDHKNNLGLDNRRKNLRIATHRQNNAARILWHGELYGFRGVTAEGFRFRARFDGTHLGMFGNPEAAARTYDRAALLAFGGFALTNFPLEDYVHIPEVLEELRRTDPEIPF